jgi:hypothetical protein
VKRGGEGMEGRGREVRCCAIVDVVGVHHGVQWSIMTEMTGLYVEIVMKAD